MKKGAKQMIDEQQQENVDDIEDAEVEALIALVEERIIENLTRMIERMLAERRGYGA